MADENVNGLPQAVLPVVGTDKLVITRDGIVLQQVQVSDMPSTGGGGVAGVSAFNGRDGDVFPEVGDYDSFFTTPAEATTIANAAAAAAVTAHESAANPHGQYTTDAEATAIANAAVMAHESAANPHGQYTTDAEATTIANAAAAAAVSGHEAAADPHGQYKITVSDEGVPLTTGVRSINFSGSGVLATVTGDAVNVNIAGGGGGGVAGVSTFNGRDGDVFPEVGDYDSFFTTPAEATTIANAAAAAAVTAHESAANPHGQYTTDAEAATIAGSAAASAVTAHESAANPHGQYTTDAEATAIADARASAAVSSHVAGSDPHGQYKIAVLDEGSPLTAFAQSLNFTGAGVTVTNTGGAVTLSIPGGGGGGGGYSLDQLATDTNALATTPAADGDFNVTLRPGSTPAIIKVLSTDAEVILARGDRANLNSRITAISNYAASNPGTPIPGQVYDNAIKATNNPAYSYSANRFQAAPFMTSSKMRIDQFGIVVATLAAGVLARAFIYDADPVTFMPRNRLFQGLLELDCSTTGFKAHSLDFVFEADRVYWVGANANGTVSCRGQSPSNMLAFGPINAADNTYRNIFANTGFPTDVDLPLVSTLGVLNMSNSGVAAPLVRMRAAEL